MPTYTICSDTSLQDTIGNIRQLYDENKYLKVSIKLGKDRSLDQNRISHAWYEQLARELKEDDVLGWKALCKLHYGVPILLAEDEEFREGYNFSIAHLMYEQKLYVMRDFPITSRMNKKQLSKYLEDMQDDFLKRGVILKFPEQ